MEITFHPKDEPVVKKNLKVFLIPRKQGIEVPQLNTDDDSLEFSVKSIPGSMDSSVMEVTNSPMEMFHDDVEYCIGIVYFFPLIIGCLLLYAIIPQDAFQDNYPYFLCFGLGMYNS